jgi:signal transduction histidine kinase
MLGVVSEITERKTAEKAIRDNEERLKDLNATKDKFFSIIAHDLKTPFTSIIGFIELLIEKIQKKDNDEVEEYARIIQKSSWKAMELLTNLYEWSRLQTGKMEYKPVEIDLVETINEVIDHVNDSAWQKSIEISKDFPESLKIIADKPMISTVLRNLLSNSIKFTNTGGFINVSVVKRENELMVSVKDNGVGISEQALENLFRIDVSHSTSGTKGEEGTGLGLLLCKEFILKHNGNIWVESEIGRGSEFLFTLPNHLSAI